MSAISRLKRIAHDESERNTERFLTNRRRGKAVGLIATIVLCSCNESKALHPVSLFQFRPLMSGALDDGIEHS